jgi:hypothetical protein
LWKEVAKEDKRTLCIEFRSQDEFKDKLQQAEKSEWPDGYPGYCWWLLWKAKAVPPEQSAQTTPDEAEPSTPASGNQSRTMFDPITGGVKPIS